MIIIWCILPEIWSVTDKRFCRFRPFFALLPPPSNPIKLKFCKTKKDNWRYHHFIKWTKNHDDMLHCSLDMARNECNCSFSFWANFNLFSSLKDQKTKKKKNKKKKKKKKKKKNPWRYHHFIIIYQYCKIHEHML